MEFQSGRVAKKLPQSGMLRELCQARPSKTHFGTNDNAASGLPSRPDSLVQRSWQAPEAVLHEGLL